LKALEMHPRHCSGPFGDASTRKYTSSRVSEFVLRDKQDIHTYTASSNVLGSVSDWRA
jgi:hypothetical protein